MRVEIRFYKVLETIETFFDFKKKNLGRPKNHIFPRGSTHAFLSKNAMFLIIFLAQIRLEIRFNNVLDGKETFFD